MNWDNIYIALEIMGKGMAGIFIAIFIIMCFVLITGRLSKKE